jgi:hypothetical protein
MSRKSDVASLRLVCIIFMDGAVLMFCYSDSFPDKAGRYIWLLLMFQFVGVCVCAPVCVCACACFKEMDNQLYN